MSDFVLSAAEAESRLKQTRAAMAAAAVECGRNPEEITLLGVSKTFPAEAVKTYLAAGLHDFGESYIQEAREKAADLADYSLNWHFIGHLQANKAKYAAAMFSTIHSVDNLGLAKELNRRAAALNKKIEIYIQVNISGEASKSGLEPSGLPMLIDGLSELSSLVPKGLMTMPPYDPNPELSRPYFAALRKLRDEQAPHLSGLSMGMSGDFKVAIEEGATVIRVGTALFGPR